MINPAWIKARAADVRRADVIDPKLYERYNVKRGLRNSDGTGVIAGLTQVSNVHGYVLSEGDKTPSVGKLTLRGLFKGFAGVQESAGERVASGKGLLAAPDEQGFEFALLESAAGFRLCSIEAEYNSIGCDGRARIVFDSVHGYRL